MKKIFYLIIFIISSLNIQAQDPHFSQPGLSALFLNPAQIGVMNGNYRLSVMYRTQWFEVIKNHPYLTYAAAFDWRLCPNTDGAWLGIGLKMMGDRAGFSVFERYTVAGNIAGHINLNGNSYVSLGLEMGGLFYKIGYSDLRFDTQFDGEDYVASLSNMENFNEQQLRGKFDISGGLMFFNTARNIYGGVGFFHLNKPDYILVNSNIPSDSQVDIKFVGHISWKPTLNRRLSLQPQLVVQNQGKFWQGIIGNGFVFQIGPLKDQQLVFNLSTRLGGYAERVRPTLDALIFQVRYEVDHLSFGISYDVNASTLRKASAFQGAFEVGLTYQFKREERDCVSCFNYHNQHIRKTGRSKRRNNN